MATINTYPAAASSLSALTATKVPVATSATTVGDGDIYDDTANARVGIGGAAVASAGPFQVHDGTAEATTATASNVLASFQKAGTATMVVRSTDNNVEGGFQVLSTQVLVGSTTGHSTEIVIGGSSKLSIDAYGAKQNGRNRELKGTDVASAAAITLGTNGNAFALTGTTAVTSIVQTGWQTGCTIMLRLPSTLVLTHGAGAISLSGGGNITGAAGGTWVQLTLNGTVWEQTAPKVDLV